LDHLQKKIFIKKIFFEKFKGQGLTLPKEKIKKTGFKSRMREEIPSLA